MIDKAERLLAKEEHKDELTEMDAAAKEKGDGEMNQEDIDILEAGILCTVNLLESAMKEGPHYAAISNLTSYNDLYTTADNNIEEKFSSYS